MWLFRISKISTFESNSQHIEMPEVYIQVVPNIKDINFWEQFTTMYRVKPPLCLLFRISKISTFESNSQLALIWGSHRWRCSEYQRYQLLRAIHNCPLSTCNNQYVVPNIKDINFWEQFTTTTSNNPHSSGCSEYQRYQLLRAIHNFAGYLMYKRFVVPNIKDINFWEQFTTAIG